MSDIVVKQGASLQLAVQINNDDGSGFPLAGVTILAQVRSIYGPLIDTLVLTPTGTPGQLSVLQATDGWPTGRFPCDFKIIEAGVILKSDTLYIQVNEAVTT